MIQLHFQEEYVQCNNGRKALNSWHALKSLIIRITPNEKYKKL